MQNFIEQSILPLFPTFPDQQSKTQCINQLKSSLKTLLKNETAGISRDLASKTKQMFVLSSDLQTAKQQIKDLEGVISKLKQQRIALDQQMTKQRIMYQSMLQQEKQNFSKQKNNYEKQLKKAKQDYEQLEDKSQIQVRELKKEHQQRLTETIEQQRRAREQALQNQKKQFQQEKASMIAENNQAKSQLIKKYETKIHNINEKNDKQRQQFLKKHQSQILSLHNKIGKLQSQNHTFSTNNSRLTSELKHHTDQHHKFYDLYSKIKQHYDDSKVKFNELSESLSNKLTKTQNLLEKQQAEHIKNVRELKRQLADTIMAKDTKYIEKVEQMTTEHKDVVDSLKAAYSQEKQHIMNDLQVKRYQDLEEAAEKYRTLEQKYDQRQIQYGKILKKYEKQMKQMKQQHEDMLQSLNQRAKYELDLQNANNLRQFSQTIKKYELQIETGKKEHKNQIQQLMKKMNQERISSLNKQMGRYEAMIADLKSYQQVQLRQKVLQFERKAKGFQKKLNQADKKKSQIKLSMQRMKLQMQMKIDSMVDLHKQLQQDIFELNSTIQDHESEKSRIVSEYEVKLVMVNNEMQLTRDQCDIRVQQIKGICQEKLANRNRQFSRISDKLKRQTVELIKINVQKTKHMEKQYAELKKIASLKTSLPEDVDALKIFHQAYLDKEEELKKQKNFALKIQKELQAKNNTDRMFIFKTQPKNIISDTKFPTFLSKQI